MHGRKKMSNAKDILSGQNKDEYSFIKETIKHRPIDKKRLLIKTIYFISGAILFGALSGVVFCMMVPVAGGYVEKRQSQGQEVRIPEDEPEETGRPEQEDTPTPQVVEVPRSFALEDYEKIYNEILNVAESPRKALVHVAGVKGEENLLDNSRLSTGESYGIVIQNSGQELYILTELAAISEAKKVRVTFADGSTSKASQVKGDTATGLAVIRVPVESVKESALSGLTVAQLGNSYSLVQGKSVIAIGSPAGYNDSVIYGNVTSVSNQVFVTDMEYNLLTTDILGSGGGSGVLLDTSGCIIGVIAMDYGPEDTGTMVKALSISQLKPLIEKLSNGNDIIYMGILGQEITKETAENTEIPRGVYVNQVEAESPAMEAGIQAGDVITAFNEKKVHTMQRYYTELQKCHGEQQVEVSVMRQGPEGYGKTKVKVTLDVK